MNQNAVCHEGARASRDASRATAASAPAVSRSAPAVVPGLAAAGFAPSRMPAGTSFPGAAQAPRKQRARPSQIPVASARKDGADGPWYTSPVLDVVGKGGGQPLDPKARADMEDWLGADFSDVRIHTGDQAARSAAAISAKAYTVGHDVVFGQGSFDPASREGRHRLAHELVHVQQQRLGPVTGTDSGGGVAISDPADSFEREAEATAARVASGPLPGALGDLRGHHPGRRSVQLTGSRSVQRCGGVPCDCAADEQDRVQGSSAGAPALQPVQRAPLAPSDALEGDPNQMPKVLSCPPAISSASAPTEILLFPNLGTTLTPMQEAQIAAFVEDWITGGEAAAVRIDGFASKPGSEALNWQLSCERALAVKAELMRPLPTVEKGIPENFIELFMHGETAQFGDESRDRRVSLSLGPAPTPPQPPGPQPTPSRSCGPEIGPQLTDVLTRIQSDFNAKSGWSKELACDNLVFPTPAAIMAWDILDLFLPHTGWLETGGPCGVPLNEADVEDPVTCGNTVQVDNKCWLAGTVNYAMYGIACRLCSDRHRSALPPIIGPLLDQWSLFDMQLWVRLYNIADRKGGGTGPPLAWATATYLGGPSARPSAASNRSSCPVGCTMPAAHTSFDYAWPPLHGSLSH